MGRSRPGPQYVYLTLLLFLVMLLAWWAGSVTVNPYFGRVLFYAATAFCWGVEYAFVWPIERWRNASARWSVRAFAVAAGVALCTGTPPRPWRIPLVAVFVAGWGLLELSLARRAAAAARAE